MQELPPEGSALSSWATGAKWVFHEARHYNRRGFPPQCTATNIGQNPICDQNVTILWPNQISSIRKVQIFGRCPWPNLRTNNKSTDLSASKFIIGTYSLTIAVTTNRDREVLTNINLRLLRNNAGRTLSTVIMAAQSGDHIEVSADELIRLISSTQDIAPRGIGFMAALQRK